MGTSRLLRQIDSVLMIETRTSIRINPVNHRSIKTQTRDRRRCRRADRRPATGVWCAGASRRVGMGIGISISKWKPVVACEHLTITPSHYY
jgi:hypothetical protein